MPINEIAVIDCTLEWPKYTDRFRELIDNAQIYKAQKFEFPEDPEAIVISGSTSGVYEKEAWIQSLIQKVSEYIEEDVPILGLCFGQQVIAKAAGGEVKLTDGYEIGYREIRIGESEIFKGLEDEEYPFSVHQDNVTRMPENFREIASSNKSIQGIEHVEKPVFGVQFHPELIPEIAERSIRDKDFNEERKNRLLNEVNEENFKRAKRCLKIIENFERIASNYQAEEEAEVAIA